MDQGTIFISYRREDTSGFTRAVQDQLVKRFSKDRVFMDVDAIEPGLRFDQVIDEAVGRCKVVLVMIGKQWLDLPKSGGPPRLHEPGDSVRIEIAAALSRDIRVIPVLVDGATMPAEDALPEPLRLLARRNAIEIGNTRFDSDISRLADVIAKVIGPPAKPTTSLRRPLIYSFAIAAGGLAILAGAYLFIVKWNTCTWNLTGDWTFEQSKGPNVSLALRQDGKQLTGYASTESDRAARYPITSGTVEADTFGFDVPWGTDPPTIGAYEGRIDEEGKVSGTTWDRANPVNRAHWLAARPANCVKWLANFR